MCCVQPVCMGQASAGVGQMAFPWLENLQAEESTSHLLMGVPAADWPKQQIKGEGEQYPHHWLINKGQ